MVLFKAICWVIIFLTRILQILQQILQQIPHQVYVNVSNIMFTTTTKTTKTIITACIPLVQYRIQHTLQTWCPQISPDSTTLVREMVGFRSRVVCCNLKKMNVKSLILLKNIIQKNSTQCNTKFKIRCVAQDPVIRATFFFNLIQGILLRCKLKSVVARITTHLKHCHQTKCCCFKLEKFLSQRQTNKQTKKARVLSPFSTGLLFSRKATFDC